jgi:hypothetical protein
MKILDSGSPWSIRNKRTTKREMKRRGRRGLPLG